MRCGDVNQVVKGMGAGRQGGTKAPGGGGCRPLFFAETFTAIRATYEIG